MAPANSDEEQRVPFAPPPAVRPAVGRMLVLAAVLLWSTSGLFAKARTFDAWPEDDRGLLLAFWRAMFAGLCLLPLVRRPRWRRTLLPMTLSFAIMNASYLSAMTLTTAANAIWLQSTAPLWVFVIGVLLLGEPFDRRQAAPLVCGLAGVGVILFFELRQPRLDAAATALPGVTPGQLGVALGLLAGITYGIVVMCLRRLRDEDAFWLIAANHLVAAAAMLPFVLRLGIWPSPYQLAVLTAFGGLQMGVPYVLFARGLRHIGGAEATGIGLLEPLLVPLWVWLLGIESPRPWTLAGGGLILLGLVLRYARSSRVG
jgi:drug/metabolite transporter, DME family